jgi:hypothetical protein
MRAKFSQSALEKIGGASIEATDEEVTEKDGQFKIEPEIKEIDQRISFAKFHNIS